MAYYRLYLLDEHGTIMQAHEAELTDDPAALAQAMSFDHPHGVSIWQEARKVADLTAEQRAAARIAAVVSLPPDQRG